MVLHLVDLSCIASLTGKLVVTKSSIEYRAIPDTFTVVARQVVHTFKVCGALFARLLLRQAYFSATKQSCFALIVMFAFFVLSTTHTIGFLFGVAMLNLTLFVETLVVVDTSVAG